MIDQIDQIDQIEGSDTSIHTALTDVLGQENGTAVFEKILSNNPSLSDNTTGLQVSLQPARSAKISPG
jgi:hypothetical protein